MFIHKQLSTISSSGHCI